VWKDTDIILYTLYIIAIAFHYHKHTITILSNTYILHLPVWCQCHGVLLLTLLHHSPPNQPSTPPYQPPPNTLPTHHNPSTEPVHRWKGVKLDHSTGRVNKIILAENRLEGVIPQEIGRLTSLIELDLRCNQIRGPLPV